MNSEKREERPQKIRSFIALELSDEARGELSRIINALKASDADVKWIHPETVHLTLKFLGYVPEEKIPKIAESLKEIAQKTSPFDIALGNLGVFPSWGYVKVLWVGVEEGNSQVKDLARRVEEAVALEGFEKEKRPFSSHLTLGRVRRVKNKDKLKEIATSTAVKPVRIHISKIVLFKSTLTQKGAIHLPLATLELAG